MDKNRKTSSQPNIIRMTKTNYQKALDYYGLQDKSAKTIAARMKIKIKMTKDKKNKLPSLSNQVESELVRRWKDDSRDVTATYNLSFKRYNKETKKYSDGVIKFNVRGDKRDIPKLAKAAFDVRVEKLIEDYDEWKDFDYYQSGDLIEMEEREGNGLNNGKTITTTKGGQRKVGMRGNKAVIKMRDRFALKFAEDDEQEWDKGEGTCVFDYLYAKYKCKEMNGTKTYPKSREDAYKWLDELLRINETERPLEEGVSVYQLENFCDKFKCNMYAYDETEGLIEIYNPKTKTSENKPLVFRVFDGHFSPYPDNKRKHITNKNPDNKGIIKSNDIEAFEDKKKDTEKKKYEIIAPSKEEYDAIKEELANKNYPVSVRNQIALNYLKQNGMKVPYPLNENSLVVDDGSIVKLRYDDKIVLTEPINPRLKKWYEDNGEEYNGEGYINILNRICMDKYNFKIADAPFLSKPNVEILNALSAGKIKWRTHLGLTEAGLQYPQEKIIEMLQTGEAIGVDICKCYCDALYTPRERWIVFNGKEQLEEYDGKPLTLGLYFVVTDDMSLFHKSNWYSRQMIWKARQEGIKYRITHQIRCVDIIWEKEGGINVKASIEKAKVEGKLADPDYRDENGIFKPKEEDIVRWKLDNTNLFGSLIDEIVELTEQDEDWTLTKRIINSISGYLGKTQYKTKTAAVNTNLKDIWENWIVADKDNVLSNNEELYISEIKDEEEWKKHYEQFAKDNSMNNEEAKTNGKCLGSFKKSFYIYGVKQQVENISTGLPMYIQILDSANIALYDMIKAVGGECIYRKTDCIVSVGGKLPKTNVYREEDCLPYIDTWGKYRLVDDAKNYNYVVEMNVDRAVEAPKLSDEWEYWDFNSSDDWRFIIETFIKKGGGLISGRAGTGKSHIIKKAIEAGLLSADRETRMAPTNKAARNIDGTTIHKNLAINGNNNTNEKTLMSLGKYKVFVIDEISMIYADLWNKLCLLKKKTGAIFILLGDYRQCPPIESGTEMDYFNHPFVKYLANYNCCELTKPQRYDMPLWNWLEDFYEKGETDDEVICKKKLNIENILYRRNIVFYNDTRKTINELCMKEKIKSLTKYMVLEVPEKCKNEQAQLTYIYKDLPIMVITCNKDYGIINSDDMIVEDFDPNASTITISGKYLEEEELVIESKEFHKLFVVNYAATTHKSQGATISEDINIFDWDRLQKDRKVGYTAVSRAKKPNQLTIVENYREFRFRNDNKIELDEDYFDPPDEDY